MEVCLCVPAYIAKTLCYLGWRLGNTTCVLHTFLHLHVRHSLPDPKCDAGKHSALGTTPSPQEAVSPFNFSGDMTSYTILGKRVGKEQRKVILASGHSVQPWASRHGESKVKL